MNRCPRCFHRLDLDPRSVFICAGSCPSAEDPVASAFHGGSVASLPWFELDPRAAATRPDNAYCPRCSSRSDQQACAECHAVLPSGWRGVRTTCIAMAGARATGKSFYIAVAVRQAAELATKMRSSLSAMTADTESVYREHYERPLYAERNIIQATAVPEAHAAGPAQTPLIFSLGQDREGRPHALVIRDVAGEAMEGGQLVRPPYRFFAHADGIIFLFDPLRVPRVRAMLSGLIPEENRTGGDPMGVLSAILRHLRRPPEKSSVPFAVVCSKFDTLQQLRAVEVGQWPAIMANVGAAILREPEFAPRYDHEDGTLLDAEVRSLLNMLDGSAVVGTVEEAFTDHRFFAVSALGSAPDGEHLHPRGIAPFRCLDPLLWIMARNFIVPVGAGAT